MKIMFWGLMFALSASAMANVEKAEYYILDGWQGEYPTGYQMLANVETTTVNSPTNPASGPTCTLKKNSVIHPWAEKTKSQFTTLSPVERYTAIADFDIYQDESNSIHVKAGQTVLQLAYIAEGFCRMSVEDQIGEDTCLVDGELVTLTSASPFSVRSFFKTACTEGYEGWIDAAILARLVLEEPKQIKYAEVIDYGTVEEP